MVDLGPVVFELLPGEIHVLDLPTRAINPYLAIMEGAWILSGSQLLKPLSFITSVFNSFSDDGETLHGAYGHRLKQVNGIDLIEEAIKNLQNDPSSRRVVLPIYLPTDLLSRSKDIPCNVSMMLRIVNGRLDLTVINRSNDLIYGVPYNCFSFSVIHYYVADRLSIDVGIQRHYSNCMHVYEVNREFALKIDAAGRNRSSVLRPDTRTFMKAVFDNAETLTALRFDDVQDERLRSFFQEFERHKGEQHRKALAVNNDWLSNLASEWSMHQRTTSVARL
ncbi:thymidylate synthase [Rhizobium leguminosarum]|nr:thymidylate synthase [Rhizobium leguminosarum]MBY5449955.1 thymidylate synthase [Rhizobium leguminosarum]